MKIKTRKFDSKAFYKTLSGSIMDILEMIDTPKAIALAISFRNSEYRNVDTELLDADPESYLDAIDYLNDSQAVALFKKSQYLETDKRLLDEKAVASFLSLEAELKDFNTMKKENSFYQATIYTAARIMRSLLGPLPEVEDLKVSYTSGATFSLTAENATFAAKISNRLDVTPTAFPYLLKLLGSDQLLFDAYKDFVPACVRGNKFSTVPKDFRKVRTICKEPLGNMILQRGLGLHIKNRLKKVGIFIETGQSDHRELLRHNQDAWSTIDQSDASDRISDSLVKDLLPLDWYHMLNRVRSRETLIDGKWHKLEKFMTQGNGFTFELETAIFYCLIQAMHINLHGKKTVVSVYGDDVIVPVHHGSTVVENLNLFGLKVNTEKSYVDGPFKESCGFDILHGKEVRPFYLKEFEAHETLSYVQFCNYISRVVSHIFLGNPVDICSTRPWKRCLSGIPEEYRFYGPSSLGDTVIHTSLKPSTYTGAYYKGGILYVRTYRKTYGKECYEYPRRRSELAYAILGGDSNGNLKRNSVYRLKSAMACPVNWA